MKKILLLILSAFTAFSCNVNAQWSLTSFSGFSYRLGSNGTSVFAGGDVNTGAVGLERSVDSGATVSNASTPPVTGSSFPDYWTTVVGGNGTNLFAQSSDPVSLRQVFVSTNNGSPGSWTSANTGLPGSAITTFSFPGWIPNGALAGTDGNGIYVTSNAGALWTQFPTSGLLNMHVRSIATISSLQTVIAGTDSGVYYYDGFNPNWNSINGGLTTLHITSILYNNSTFALFAATDTGGVFQASSVGSTWNPVNNGLTNRHITALAMSGTDLFAGTDTSGVFYSNNAGLTWTQVNTGLTNRHVQSLLVVGSNIYVGTSPNANLGIYKRTLASFGSCVASSSTITPAPACFSYTSPSGTHTWTTSNTYTDVIPNAAGCDSIITINLTINTVDTSVTTSGSTLTSNETGATYQWLNCTGFSAINNETNFSFTPTSDGNYAVEVTKNGCTDTSSCRNVITLGVEDLLEDVVSFYPNPAREQFTMEFGKVYPSALIEITDLVGKLVYTDKINDSNSVTVKLKEPAGFYIVSITANENKKSFKLLKE